MSSDLFNRKELSLLTIKTYTSCLNKILELAKSGNPMIFIEQPDYIIDLLEKHYTNDNTKKTKIGAVLAYIKSFQFEPTAEQKMRIEDAYKLYLEYVDKYNNNIKDKLSSHTKSPEEMDGWTNADEIETIKQNLYSAIPKQINNISDLNKFRNYIIYLLYQDIPSRLDFGDSKILYKSNKNLDNTFNYIILDKDNKTVSYYLNQYKTAKTYGAKIIKLNDNLYDILEKYMKLVHQFNKEKFLLLNDNGDKLSRKRLSDIYSGLGNSIGKRLGVSKNRKIAISNLIPIKKMEELASKMGHSVNEAISVYAKI